MDPAASDRTCPHADSKVSRGSFMTAAAAVDAPNPPNAAVG